MSINQEIADRLREIATLLEEQRAGPFRVNAYQRAASTVVHLDEPISEIIEQKGLPGLIALAGIGEGIARSIYEYVAMGRMGFRTSSTTRFIKDMFVNPKIGQ